MKKKNCINLHKMGTILLKTTLLTLFITHTIYNSFLTTNYLENTIKDYTIHSLQNVTYGANRTIFKKEGKKERIKRKKKK